MAECKDTFSFRREYSDKKPYPMSAMNSNENHPPPVNRITPTRENSYWFAHGGVEDSNNRNNSKDNKETQLQKEREERVRIYREQQEEERIKRLKEIENSFELSKKFREQQEEDRRRKIEEARARESERRQQVEERKRLIWEAEQERKGAILRRNLEREARIEARRNAQRNSMSFAFGSSTPRTFDLDLAALGNSPLGCSLMSSVSTRRSEEKDVGVKRATSACSLDRKADDSDYNANLDNRINNNYYTNLEYDTLSVAKQIAIAHMKSEGTKACLTMSDDDNSFINRRYSLIDTNSPSSCWLMGSGALVGEDIMSRSMISLSSASRGRRRTDLTPIMPRERSITPHTVPRGNMNMRAVSMTRLDQLAQPRRRYLESSRDNNSSTATTPTGPRTVSPSMSKSMVNLANAPSARRIARMAASRGQNMSSSMMQLPGSNNVSPKPNPTSPPYKPLSAMRSAQSMTYLGPPRLTRTARLRADALANARQEGKTTSMMNLHKSDNYYSGKLLGKDGSRSPSRPQSSLSGRSEMSGTSSQASSVNLRPRPPPRKPRPVSYAGPTTDRSSYASDKQIKSRESSSASLLGPKPFKPKTNDSEVITKVHPPIKKPVPPPKSAQVLAKARNHPVPTKDNLRKTAKVPLNVQKQELPHENEISASNPISEPKTESPSSPEISTADSFTTSSRRSEDIEKQDEKIIPQPIVEQVIENKTENEKVQPINISPEVSNMESSQIKPRITSEEEAKAAIAEKRRLAREQAEREAELERQRQEEIKRQEEERRIQEELEQKRLEEEQIRLAELHRKLEEEKLQKAIEEQKQRELEEQARKDEEARLRMEKEEQERKAREEAEKQRLELEERLRKEEQERAERKKRVEQIMSRTRNKSNAAATKTMPSPATENPPTSGITPLISQTTESTKSSNVILNSTVTGVQNGNSDIVMQSNVFSNNTTAAPPLNLDILMTHSGVKNGYHSDNVEPSFIKNNSANNCVPNRTPNSDSISPLQTNGYSSHEEMSLTSSPEDKSEKSNSSNGLLLNLHPPPPNVIPERDNQLIDIGGQTNSENENYLIHPDIVNSNLVSSNDPFHAFENSLPKKQETAIADLLS